MQGIDPTHSSFHHFFKNPFNNHKNKLTPLLETSKLKTPRLKFPKTKLAAAISATIVSGASNFVDAANLTLTPSNSSPTEGDNISLTIDLAPTDELPFTEIVTCTVTGTINVVSGDSSAEEGSDFTINDTDFSVLVSVNFTEGDNAGGSQFISTTADTINISITDDNIAEGDEQFVIGVNNITNNCSFYSGVAAPETETTFTIIDNDIEDGGNNDGDNNGGNGGFADTLGLNQRQVTVATALDQSCEALGNIGGEAGGGLNDAQNDLLGTCNILAASDDLARDLDALSHEELISMGTLSLQGTALQVQNLSKQLRRIRQGIRGIDIAGLQLNIDGQTLSGNQLNRLLGSGAGDGKLHSKWGTFLGGSIQVGEYNPSSTNDEFEFDVASLFAGVDYQLTKNVVVGGALSYTDSSADTDSNGSESELSGISLGIFGSYYYKDAYYIDGIISIGDSDYSTERNITFDGDTTLARGDTSGDELTLTINGGYYIRQQAYFLHLFGSVNYIDAAIDSFREKPSDGSTGHLLSIGDQNVESLTSNLGVELGWAINTQTAVISPQFSIDWEHQYEDDARAISGRFLGDPTNTSFAIETEDQDRNYLNAGFTLNAVFKGGFSAYTSYEIDLERDDFDVYDFSVGGRWEL